MSCCHQPMRRNLRWELRSCRPPHHPRDSPRYRQKQKHANILSLNYLFHWGSGKTEKQPQICQLWVSHQQKIQFWKILKMSNFLFFMPPNGKVNGAIRAINQNRHIPAHCSPMSEYIWYVRLCCFLQTAAQESSSIIPPLFVRPKWVRLSFEWCSSVSFTSVRGSVVTPWPAVSPLSITLGAQREWAGL